MPAPFIAIGLLTTASSIVIFAIAACATNALLQFTVVYQMGLITNIDNNGKLTLLIAFILAFGGALGPGIFGAIKTETSFNPAYLLAAVITTVAIVLTLLASYLATKQRETATAASTH